MRTSRRLVGCFSNSLINYPGRLTIWGCCYCPCIPPLLPVKRNFISTVSEDRKPFYNWPSSSSRWAVTSDDPTVDSDNFTRNNQRIYTGRPQLPSGIEYYENFTQNNALPKKVEIEKKIINMIHNNDPFSMSQAAVGSECLGVAEGDFVEVCFRTGGIESGVVLSRESDGSVLLYTIDGRKIRVKESFVSFALAGLVNKKALDLVLDSTKNSIIPLEHLSHYLKLFIRTSINIATKLEPYLDVIYANHAKSEGIHGISLNQLTQELFNSARVNNTAQKYSAAMLFSVYLLLKKSSDTPFGRFSPRSTEFFPLSEKYIESKNKVNERLRDCGKGFLEELQSSNYNDKDLASILKGYLIYPDPSLIPTINTIMSSIYPHKDSDNWLTSPSSVYKMLRETKLIRPTENPLLSPEGNSNFWWSSSSSTHGGEAYDGVRSSLESLLNRSSLREKTTITPIEWEAELPVYVFSHSKDIAYSIDIQKSDSWTLYIHILDVAHLIGFEDRKILEKLEYRGKSVYLQTDEYYRPLFPTSFQNEFGFSSEQTSSVNCITLSVKIEPWNRTNWNAHDVDIFPTIIPNFLYFETEDLDLSMGWRYEYIGDEIFNSQDLLNDKDSMVTISRLNRYALSTLREIMESFSWERTDDSLPPYTKTFENYNLNWYSGSRKVTQEARICANRICQLYSQKHHENVSLVETDIGYPMDHLVSLIPQWQLQNYFERQQLTKPNNNDNDDEINDNFKLLTKKFNTNDLKSYYKDKISPQNSLMDHLYKRFYRYHKLSNLEDNIRRSNRLYIFRCTMKQEEAPHGSSFVQYPDIALAYCEELGMEVEVALSVPGAKLYNGDRILCNQILELSPIDGLLVLSL